MEESVNNKNFWSRKISIWHFVYIILFCIFFSIVTLLIMPGRINDDAYQNFSFAATITSIVLALVSIVYSLQSGLSSVGQLHSVIEIESQISNEIKKFSGIDEKIRNALVPISSQVGSIQKTQDTIRQAQDDIHNELLKISSLEIPKDDGGNTTLEGPAILYILLYAAVLSKTKAMDMPYHLFAKYVGPQSKYCEGLLDGMAVLQPDKIKIEQGSRPARKKVTVFDENSLGTLDVLKNKASSLLNEKLSKNLLTELDNYFSDINNQLPTG